MWSKNKHLFSLSVLESEYCNDKQKKIEITGCKLKGNKCNEQLSAFNKSYLKSSKYYRDKDFENSIATLKTAFYKTSEIEESSCTKCANIYRSTITASLENIHDELKNMSSGIFATNRYKTSLQEANKILADFRKVG